MTPFGEKIRQLRQQRNITQKQMAEALQVSPAYLSALENGQRSAPSFELTQRIIAYFNIIWDDAEELAQLAALSHPRIVIDTSHLSPKATFLANLLAQKIDQLDQNKLVQMLEIINQK